MNGLTKLVIDSYRHKYDYQRSIDRLTLEIEAIEEEMKGLSHRGVEMTKAQEKSQLPMPTTTSPIYSNCRILNLIEKKTEKERQIDALLLALQQADLVKRLSVEDQKLMQELYHTCRPACDVADNFGYSKQGMYKHIHAAIEKIL